jgi:adenosylcobinamide-phosphate synthase
MNGMAVSPVVAGVVADALFGEPPTRWHPVVWFGTLMTRVENRLWRDSRFVGVVHLAAGVGTAWACGWLLHRAVGRRTATAIAVAVCSAGRMLDDEALGVAGLLERGDLAAARIQLGRLVGRHTEQLDESDVCRAVIESVAENSVDAVTSTVAWATVGAAPLAFTHRAVNTLDAMVGHRSDRYRDFGWASARTDDIANYGPSRLGAAMVASVRPRRAQQVWRTIRRDASRHPSPNGGVIEAAFAAALGVRLGGVNHYAHGVEDRGTLGDGRPPTAQDIRCAVRLRRQATVTLCLLVSVFGRRRWPTLSR